MKDISTYAFTNAKIRSLVSFLLTSEELDKLIGSRDLQEAAASLKNTAYGRILKEEFSDEEQIKALEKELGKYDIDIFGKIKKSLAGEPDKLIELLIQRYELEQLKLSLRIWSKRSGIEDSKYLIRGISRQIDFDSIISAKNIEDIILILDGTPYKQPILKALEKYKESKALFYLEASLDRDYFSRVWQEVGKLSGKDKEIALRLIGIEVDIQNINSIIRLKQYFNLPAGQALKIIIPGGLRINEPVARKVLLMDKINAMIQGVAIKPYEELETLLGKGLERSGLYMIESILYQALIKEARKMLCGYPFTIGTILAYFILKRAETQNIISILYGKSYGLDSERIRGSLVC